MRSQTKDIGLGFLFVSLAFFACANCKVHPKQLSTSLADSSNMDIQTYWAKCAEKLGPFPPLSCQKSDHTLTVDGVTWSGKVLEIDVERHFVDGTNGFTEGHFRKISNADLLDPVKLISPENGTCLKPSFNSQESGQCIPGNRLMWFTATLPNIGEVQWAGFCRNEYARPPGAPFYEVISLIGHAPNTGDTCFFESKFSKPAVREVKTSNGEEKRSVYFGSSLPKGDVWEEWLSQNKLDSTDAKVRLLEREIRQLSSVNDPGAFGWALPSPGSLNAGDFYELPSKVHNFYGACYSCHTAGPWLRNQVISDIETISYDTIPRKKSHKYRIVGFEDLVPEKGRELVTPQRLISGPNAAIKKCTTCHDIGNSRYCKDIVPIAQAISQTDAITMFFSAETKTYMERIWNSRASFSGNLKGATVHWEKKSTNRFLGLSKLSDSEVRMATESVLNCCYEINGTKCTWETLPGWQR